MWDLYQLLVRRTHWLVITSFIQEGIPKVVDLARRDWNSWGSKMLHLEQM
jgi:hypothetical protein